MAVTIKTKKTASTAKGATAGLAKGVKGLTEIPEPTNTAPTKTKVDSDMPLVPDEVNEVFDDNGAIEGSTMPVKKSLVKKKPKAPKPETAPITSNQVGEDVISDSAPKAVVSVTHPDGTVENKDEVVMADTILSATPVAHVSYSVGLTINTGNYESIKIHASLTRPAVDNPEEIDKVFGEVVEWVDSKVNAINEEIVNSTL